MDSPSSTTTTISVMGGPATDLLLPSSDSVLSSALKPAAYTASLFVAVITGAFSPPLPSINPPANAAATSTRLIIVVPFMRDLPVVALLLNCLTRHPRFAAQARKAAARVPAASGFHR